MRGSVGTTQPRALYGIECITSTILWAMYAHEPALDGYAEA